MSIYLSHTTALFCLRRLAVANSLPGRVERCQVEEYDQALSAVRQKVPLLAQLDEGDLHVLIPRDSRRPRRQGVKCHIWESKLPTGAFLDMGSGVYLSAPELCFLQMAALLSLPQLIQLGYELCGCYAINRDFPRGFERINRPLTSPRRLAEFLAQAGSFYGRGKAEDALRWVLPNSWSPMETDTAILLTLPTKMGGYQMPTPELNARVLLEGESRIRAGKDRYYIDILWPGANVALEFNGSEHLDAALAGKDRTREIILGQMGFRCLVITSRQTFRAAEFDTLVKALCKLLGRKYRHPTDAQMQRKVELRRELFARFDANMLIA